jgi:hypothetical protein
MAVRVSSGRGFLRGALFWRCWYATEEALSRLPMLLLIPTLGAVIGTSWGVSHPPNMVEHGLVVAQQSFWGVLLSALIGGVAATAVLMLVVSLVLLTRYLRSGDGDWQGAFHGTVDDQLYFELSCAADHPLDPATLGAMTCLVKPPAGEVVEAEQTGLRINPTGCVSRFTLQPATGTFEARWYAVRGRRRLHEVARYRGPIDASAVPITIMPVANQAR